MIGCTYVDIGFHHGVVFLERISHHAIHWHYATDPMVDTSLRLVR